MYLAGKIHDPPVSSEDQPHVDKIKDEREIRYSNMYLRDQTDTRVRASKSKKWPLPIGVNQLYYRHFMSATGQ